MKTRPQQTSPMSPAVVHILLALAAGDLHGYGIIQEVARQSTSRYKLGPGTLYDNLKKLMEMGLVADSPKPDCDGRRLYRLTADGRSALAEEIERMQTMVREARLRLQELNLRETRPKRA
jgi:DNA-binding PadR family transcriptional regulator